eukprot:2308209-Pleurochrysis_carterae.AAC.1
MHSTTHSCTGKRSASRTRARASTETRTRRQVFAHKRTHSTCAHALAHARHTHVNSHKHAHSLQAQRRGLKAELGAKGELLASRSVLWATASCVTRTSDRPHFQFLSLCSFVPTPSPPLLSVPILAC